MQQELCRGEGTRSVPGTVKRNRSYNKDQELSRATAMWTNDRDFGEAKWDAYCVVCDLPTWIP